MASSSSSRWMDDDDEHEHDDAGVESGLMASLRPSRSFLPAVTTFSSRASARLSGRSGRFVLGLVLLLLLVLAFVAWSAHTEPDESEHHMVQGQPGSGGAHALLSQMQVEADVSPRGRLPVKASYRVLLVGDSLTTGQSRGPDGLISHPYRLRLEELLSTRHPHLHFQVESEAQEGECASDACVKQSLLERVQHRLEQGQYFDLAVIMAGTNDILHDFDASDIGDALEQIHKLFWAQHPASETAGGEGEGGSASLLATKTLALTVPQWGDSESWRPSRRPSALTPSEAAQVRPSVNARLASLCRSAPDQCTLVELDQWFPQHSLLPRERARKWSDDVHPTAEGYDELGLIVYQHIRHLL